MSQIACLAGAALIAIGLVGYFGQPAAMSVPDNGKVAGNEAVAESPETEEKGKSKSLTALIPAGFGAILLLCGLIGFNPGMRKHAMHAAAGIALFGGIAGLVRGVPALIQVLNNDPDVNRRTMVFLWLMVAVCFGFVFAAVNSFLNARRANQKDSKQSGPEGPS